MTIENSTTFQPSELTAALRDQYLSLSLTDDQARAILANATTHIILKSVPPESAQDGVGN